MKSFALFAAICALALGAEATKTGERWHGHGNDQLYRERLHHEVIASAGELHVVSPFGSIEGAHPSKQGLAYLTGSSPTAMETAPVLPQSRISLTVSPPRLACST